ncbi:hypothetical protein AHAS_Ahas09G0062000 [Arachis hypogaea]
MYIRNRRRGHSSIGRRVNTLPLRRDELDNIIGEGGDRNCIWELRMSLNALTTLCELLQIQGGLDKDGHVGIGEQVATFLIILAHYTKNQAYNILFAKAYPVLEDCVDFRWKWFKGCLGALDGTYVDVTVPKSDKSRHQTRKSRISTNILGVCNRNMSFVCVLGGWEGSASDSRVLKDVITQRNGLKIPIVMSKLIF